MNAIDSGVNRVRRMRCAGCRLALLLVLAGCSAVREAREAQESVAPKGEDDRLVTRVMPSPDAGSPAISLSLPDCVDFALTNRPAVLSARHDVEEARLGMKQIAASAPIVSKTPWNALELSVSGGWTAVGEEQLFKDLDGRTEGNPSAALSLDVLVYDFGRNAAEARAQAERLVASEQALIETCYSVFQDVANASFSCREKLALLSVAQTNEIAFLYRLEQTEVMFKEGESKNLDVLRARLDYAHAQEGLQVASNDVRTAFADFRHALGVPAELVCPDTDIAVTLANDTLRFPYRDPVSLARTNAPAMRVARARLRAASADVDRAIADLYPTLSASASLSWTDPMWVFGWGAHAVQSFFQGFRKKTALEIATVALRKAEAEVDMAEQNLMCSLELAMATRENAREAERAARESLASAEENLAVVAEQSLLGETDRIELTDAINAVGEARGNIATAVCAGQQAEAALFVLTGIAPVYTTSSKEEKK